MNRNLIRRIEKLEAAYQNKLNKGRVIGVVWRTFPKPQGKQDAPDSALTPENVSRVCRDVGKDTPGSTNHS